MTRLIDADALMQKIETYLPTFSINPNKIVELVETAPTVKRPHGVWNYEPKLRLVDETDDGAIYETAMRCFCSACGADFGFRKVDDAFCKYCGADMREGEVND